MADTFLQYSVPFNRFCTLNSNVKKFSGGNRRKFFNNQFHFLEVYTCFNITFVAQGNIGIEDSL